MRLAAAAAAACLSTCAGQTLREARLTEMERLRRQRVAAINDDPGILWNAGLGPRPPVSMDDGDRPMRGVLPGSLERARQLADGRVVRGVLPGSKDRLRELAELGEIRIVTVQSRTAELSGTVSTDPNEPTQAAYAGRTVAGGPLPIRRLPLPSQFDSAEAWPQCKAVINNILDQSNCGCCWAFAVAEVASDRLCIASQARYAVPLSPQHLCFCASRDGCDGGWPAQAWLHVRRVGIVTGQQQKFDPSRYSGADPDGFANGSYCAPFSLPHCHHHGPLRGDPFPVENSVGCPEVPPGQSPECPNSCAPATGPHSRIDQDVYTFEGEVEHLADADSIAHALVRCGPLAATIEAFDDFELYVSGVYHRTPNATSRGGHAVKITGFGEENGVKYWKVANSWNPYWGEKGFFRIRRGVNEVGIESEVVAPSCASKWLTTAP